MALLHCQQIREVLDQTLKQYGLHDYTFHFTQNSSWIEENSNFVREASESALSFLEQYEKHNIKYTRVELRTLKNDLPLVFQVKDLENSYTDRLCGKLMRSLDWQSGIAFPTFAYGGGLGFTVLFSRNEKISDDLAESINNFLSPWLSKFNAWSRKMVDEFNSGNILSLREVECLSLVAEGKTSKKIAESLFISKHTVDFHIRNAVQKLGCESRSQASARLSQLTLPQMSGGIPPVSEFKN